MRKQLTAQEADDLRERELLRLGQRYDLVREAIHLYNMGRSVAEFRELIRFHKTIDKRLGRNRQRYSINPY